MKKRAKREKGKIKSRGSWFNIIFCFVAFVVVLLVEIDFIGAYITNLQAPTLVSYAGLGLAVLYALSFLAILAAGFLFNIISKFAGGYPKGSLLTRIDTLLDQFLWWLIPAFAIGGYILNVALAEFVG